MNNILTAPSMGFEGFYLLEVIQEDGSLKQGPGLNTPFKNLLLNNFFTTISPSSDLTPALYSCRVGTGSTPPAITDTALVSQIAISPQRSEEFVVTSAASPGTGYWKQIQASFTFPIGGVIGNISEIGVSDYGNYLLSRSLIKDGLGNPTTITLTATDQLKVKYSIRRTQPTTTISGTLALTRDGASENHPWVWYPNSAAWNYPNPLPIFRDIVGNGTLYHVTEAPAANSTTGTPAGITAYQSGGTTGVSSYNSSTKTVTITYTFPIGTNFPVGFNIFRSLTSSEGEGYFYFPTPITKTAIQKLVITTSYTMIAL